MNHIASLSKYKDAKNIESPHLAAIYFLFTNKQCIIFIQMFWTHRNCWF